MSLNHKHAVPTAYGCASQSLSLLVKLGSIAVHAEEMLSPGGHQYDMAAIRTLLEDEEVSQWLKQMTTLGFMPVKR